MGRKSPGKLERGNRGSHEMRSKGVTPGVIASENLHNILPAPRFPWRGWTRNKSKGSVLLGA